MTIEMADRFRGALLGLAVGDALGAPLEFLSANQVLIKLGKVDSMVGGGWLSLRPGEATDDTSLALALTGSLVECMGFDAADLAKRYVAWFRKGPKGIANTIRASLAMIADGVGVETAAKNAYEEAGGETESNGTIGRTAPIGLFLRRDARALVAASLAEARITHHDPKAGSGSAAVNLLVAGILAGETDKSALVARASDILFDDDQGALNVLPEFAGKAYEELRPSENVVDSLEVALWGFVKTASFRDALVTAVNFGGSSATIGAVTGALAGAYYGAAGIPAAWLASLADKNLVDQAARRLYKAAG